MIRLTEVRDLAMSRKTIGAEAWWRYKVTNIQGSARAMAKAWKVYKFSQLFYGPYRVVSMIETGMTVQPVDKTQADTISMAYDRVHHCLEPMADTVWPTKAQGKSTALGDYKEESPSDRYSSAGSTSNVWRGCLRSRLSDEEALQKSRDV